VRGIFLGTRGQMSPTDVSLFADRARFDAAVRSRSWEWLLALRRRLGVDLQIVDDAQRPLLLPTDAPAEAALERLLASGAPGVRQALSTAVRTRTPQALGVEGVLLVLFPLMIERTVDGALVLANRTQQGTPLERTRGELDLVGLWLSSAIEAHLVSPLAAEADLDRVSSLCRLLGGRLAGSAAAEESDRQIVATFAETLAIWHDLEVYGYVETATGDFTREVSLIGADPSASPAVIPRLALPEPAEVTRMQKADVERLGFPASRDILIGRLADATGSWLLVVCGEIAPFEVMRIRVYLALLDQAIARAIEAAKARIVASLAKHLLGGDAEPEEQVRRTLVSMQEALGLSFARLDVTTSAGVPLVQVGGAPPEPEPPSEGRHLVIVRQVPQQYTMTMAVGGAAARRLTRQGHQVAQATADLLESWVQGVARQARERRVASRSFGEVLDRFARQALESGTPVTAVVLSFGDAVLRPGITQTRIGRIREQVRAADLVGRLTERDIGMLLHDTPGSHASGVIARVHRILRTVEAPDAAARVSVGIVTRSPGEPTSVSMTDEAREAARRHANAS
jgi:hypothetical protein